ncbi:MAG: orotidine-5'-phosphate decarboxylase [Thermomicrobiales bacterium]|nr:orotidine-5'-phosphate decarboxylase [Thermomicrobiales bacterium]
MTRGTNGGFRTLLEGAHDANGSLLCVGLDPEPGRLPGPLRNESDITRAIVAFNAGVIEATADLVYAYKPNLAFYMAHGVPGLQALAETRRLIPRHIPALLDAKVGDLANTSLAYAAGYFDAWDFDAITVNPYMGEDSLAPYLSRGDRGIFVLCKTSNPGSGDLQDIQVEAGSGSQPLYLSVADRVAEWADRWPATLGLVVGSTWPERLADIRLRCPSQPILLPGIGAQGGDVAGSLRVGLDASGAGLLLSASRSVIFAGENAGANWIPEVRRAALQLRDEINAARPVTA